jgi:DNA-binding NtrC family response regulator
MYMLESLSPLIGQVYKRIDKTLDSQAPLLFQGESGTGKEALARIIHGAGKPGHSRFVVVQCQTPSEERLERELFGESNGEPSATDNWGKLGEAEEGTVFLKNVGALPPRLQLRILQMLQEKVIRHPEGGEAKKICVRVIAATKKNLENEVAEGRFRQDLYYRLTVYQHDLPPLRERKPDIAKFVSHFASRFAIDSGGERFSFTPQALSLLEEHEWPDNIRELKQVVLCSIIQAKEGAGTVEQIQWVGTNGNGSLHRGIADTLEQVEIENLTVPFQ